MKRGQRCTKTEPTFSTATRTHFERAYKLRLARTKPPSFINPASRTRKAAQGTAFASHPTCSVCRENQTQQNKDSAEEPTYARGTCQVHAPRNSSPRSDAFPRQLQLRPHSCAAGGRRHKGISELHLCFRIYTHKTFRSATFQRHTHT